MIIAVDLDGTLCENKWPQIGEENSALLAWLKKCASKGDEIILWTMREGEALAEAVDWCEKRELRFAAINDNLERLKVSFGNNPRKVYADLYIDDHNAEILSELKVTNDDRKR